MSQKCVIWGLETHISEMNTTRTASQLTPSDWTETAYSYILQDDEYIVNPEQEQLPLVSLRIDLSGMERNILYC